MTVYSQEHLNGGQRLTLIGHREYGTKPLNVGQKITVAKKIDNLKDLEIWSDLHFLTSIVSSQLDKRKTKNLEKMSESLVRVAFYFQEYSNNIRLYKQALSDYKLQRNRAIERARKAEKENEKLRKQNESLSI